MKKLVLTFLAIFYISSTIFATNVNDFDLDENAIKSEFRELDALASIVSENPASTYSTLQLSDNKLLKDLKLIPVANLTNHESKNGALGIPSFLWGCAFGPIGILSVYLLTDEDKNEAKKAFYGCIVGGLVGVGCYVSYVFLIIGSSSLFWF